ncbi:reticulocyte-binding protein 2 homolog a-like [Chelonus insularis]|uniref:reticulocyte-binding protein 2 homolog a-like n=1 Tax=Chelonus insularis TaxID=460826 RepID=UPI00158D4D5E|nr:reticulocyte-binding protein 2 homolog a-like [Chelonus insularis]
MDSATKKAVKDMVLTNLTSFEELYKKEIELANERYEKKTEILKNLFQQIYTPKSGCLMPKTPKVTRKRIQTIPEDEIVTESIVKNIQNSSNDAESEDELPTRSKRGASIKASQKIKSQQTLTLNSKLRRPKNSEEIATSQTSRTRPMKRIKTSSSESDEDIGRKPAKQNKTGESLIRTSKVVIKEEPMSCTEHEDEVEPVVTKKSSLTKETSLPRQLSLRSSKQLSNQKNTPEESNVIEETLIENDTMITEPSMYEDALGKPNIANSTMIPNTTVTIDKKIMNATVVLSKMNETVTISRNSSQNHKKLSNEAIPSVLQSKAQLHHKMSALKTTLVTPQFNELITDDESSDSTDEFGRLKQSIIKSSHDKTPVNQKPKHNFTSDTDDEAISSPEEPRSKLQLKYTKHLKPKQNALFSPYAKESVKKRVEAFEKAVIDTPNDKNETVRLTRTKTRAMAKNNTDAPKTPSVSTILARKSLSKAKKIIREKEQRDHDAEKENNLMNTAQKLKVLKNDKVAQKQQLRTTPISKSRLKTPMSVNRIPQTPSNNHLLPPSKAATTSRTHNNISSTEVMSASKPISKSSSTDSLVEKRHKVSMEEDARRKKEEALKAQTEEKRRKREEKEQKIKLAREAREKLEQEKRLKLEREKEEKARQALIMQEKMREEVEKKKIAQNQRAMEKEERRKREEQLKLQRIQEQEELERRLAEQKRREQETERRRQAEARAQQLAAAEAAKLKLQFQAKVKQMQLKQQEAEMQGPLSYKIDSEPDDESDSESRPKYTIPFWAKAECRKAQLEMQPYIPSNVIMKFFGVKKTTPNLAEIFVGIEKKRLVRTSSAVWKTPPRFSMMED